MLFIGLILGALAASVTWGLVFMHFANEMQRKANLRLHS